MITINRATLKRKPAGVRTSTPWGLNDSATWFAPGIVLYSTPSHGGFHLDADRLERLHPALRKTDTRYCGASWFEEDCEAARVVLGFPAVFTADEILEAFYSLQAFDRPAAAAWASSSSGARVLAVARGRVWHARAVTGFGSACGLFADVAPGLLLTDGAGGRQAVTCAVCRRQLERR